MFPHERSLTRILSDKPFAVIGVNSDGVGNEVLEKNKEHSISWRSFTNGENGPDGPISDTWQVDGWPTIYLLDQHGVIRYQSVRGRDLDKAIEVLLKEMGVGVDLASIDHEAEDAKFLAREKSKREESKREKKN